ncbi:MAG: SLC13 family permease [Labilithrix sp.]|nr:SLC13 family permease [Labilithrix sp.]MCW5817565.1 SLC13 family permease [Labilithrix sp.]
MSSDTVITFVVLGATILLFVLDRFRLDVVALGSLLALAVTAVVPVDVALSGFANPAVIMIAGLFVVGAALTETGVADWLGRHLDAVAGATETRVIVVTMTATAFVSAFMSSTGTVAILLPVVGTLAQRRGIPAARLFMPLAFAAHLGSNLTLISTPPNLLVSDALREAGREPFRFFSFTAPGLAALAVGVGYMALLGRRVLPAGEKADLVSRALSQSDLATEFGLGGALRVASVPAASSLVGMTLAAANPRAAHAVTVVAIERAGEALRVVPPVVFAAGDEIRVLGTDAAIEAFAAHFALDLRPGAAEFALPSEESLAEVVLPRRSSLVGRTLRDAKFRDRYRANVFAVRRAEGSAYVCHSSSALRDLVLRAGDALLVKGRRKYLRNLGDERANFVLVAEPDAAPVALLDRPHAIGSVAITLAMLLVMAFGWLPNVVAVLLAAITLVLTGCVRPADVYRSVNWESIVLIAGMIPLATALERTGGTRLAVAAVEQVLHGASPIVVLALLVAITSGLGMVLSNTATAVLVAPIALKLAAAFGVRPEPFLMGVAFAASAAFATPIASPVNVLVMTPGSYRFTDYTKVGLPLQLLVLATAVALIPLVWPF